MGNERPQINVTVDVVLFRDTAEGKAILLVKRKHDPFKDRWALPGGFVEEDEDLHVAAARELEEETGLKARDLTQLLAFGAPGRDPRGRTVSIAFTGSAEAPLSPKAGDDAAEAQWHPVSRLPQLAFDHGEIVKMAMEKLKLKHN